MGLHWNLHSFEKRVVVLVQVPGRQVIKGCEHSTESNPKPDLPIGGISICNVMSGRQGITRESLRAEIFNIAAVWQIYAAHCETVAAV